MSSGKVKKAPKEMAFLQRQISQSDFDMLTSSLRLEAGAIKDMTFEWKYEVRESQVQVAHWDES